MIKCLLADCQYCKYHTGKIFSRFFAQTREVNIDEQIVQSFRARLVELRKEKGLSQVGLAKELGVSYATICRWEKENREPQIVSQGKFYAFCESKGIKFED